MAGTVPFGCGQCLPCRINRSRQWQWRQLLESFSHAENCFVTLTYNDEHLPADGGVEKRAVQLWLKKIRKALQPTRIRYFAVGEYGDATWRPHYHLSLFGVSGFTLVDGDVRCTFAQLVERKWADRRGPIGFVQVAEFNEKTAGYISGYVVKKMTQPTDKRLMGRPPEFAVQSRHPGLGDDAMKVLAAQLLRNAQSWSEGDVPHELRFGKQTIPLGRFLLRKLRAAAGLSEEYVSQLKEQTSAERSIEVLALLKDAIADEPASTPKSAYLKSVYQKILQIEARQKIKRARRPL